MERLLLAGGAEFGGRMAIPDREALSLAGGDDAPVVIIPAAAAPDNNHERAGLNGKRWFESLGARHVNVAPIIDRVSANKPGQIEFVTSARFIYLLGGFTHYLAQTLEGSLAWQAVLEAHKAGAVIAGSSAGAMVLADHYFDPGSGRVFRGLGLVPGTCVIPHFNTFGKSWVTRLSDLLPDVRLICLDERTGILVENTPNTWRVLGEGTAVIFICGKPATYQAGSVFHLP